MTEQDLMRQVSFVFQDVYLFNQRIRDNIKNPKGGKKDIHVPMDISKVALVVDEKSGKTSRVGLVKNADGGKTRVARQAKNKEIK